jgi:hypothetical protein
MSIWANVVGHFSAYVAARAEKVQGEGYNLTEADKRWILAQLQEVTGWESSKQSSGRS